MIACNWRWPKGAEPAASDIRPSTPALAKCAAGRQGFAEERYPRSGSSRRACRSACVRTWLSVWRAVCFRCGRPASRAAGHGQCSGDRWHVFPSVWRRGCTPDHVPRQGVCACHHQAPLPARSPPQDTRSFGSRQRRNDSYRIF